MKTDLRPRRGGVPPALVSDPPSYMQILGFPAGRQTLPSAKNRDKDMTRNPNPAHTKATSLVLEYQGFPGDANRR